MHQKPSQSGFIELIVLIIGVSGIAALSILNNASNVISSPLSSSRQYRATTPSVTPPAEQTEYIQADKGRGIDITDDLQIAVEIAGVKQYFTLLGVEKPATQSAYCGEPFEIQTLIQKMQGSLLYLIRYNNGQQTDDMRRYVFLADSTFLNKELISHGLATARNENHLYYNDFIAEEQNVTCKPTATPLPTRTQTRTDGTSPSPTRLPTRKPSPTVTKTITRTMPTVTPAGDLGDYLSASTSATKKVVSLNPDLILQLINLHRKSKSLAPFRKDTQLCELAEARAPELDEEIFSTKRLHEGLYNRDIPFWITENMAHYPSEEVIVNWWLNSAIHRAAIEGDSIYSCGACYGDSCAQLFTSYMPK